MEDSVRTEHVNPGLGWGGCVCFLAIDMKSSCFDYPYVVVGAGFFGCVIAERIATVLGKPVLVLEKRSYIGGNSYSEFDEETGIECHQHGSHIFHTKNRNVWEYIQKFTSFTTYRHKVLLNSDGRVYHMPINLKTINDFFESSFSPSEAEAVIKAEVAKCAFAEPRNLEEKACSLVGRGLYDRFVRGYTAKQWGRDPRELPESIINRLPVRFTYNTDYFDTPMQGVPTEGYGKLFDNLLSGSNITVMLNTDFFDIRESLSKDALVIYTGMIDRLFDNMYGELEWRSLRLEWETVGVGDFQGTTVMNYAGDDVPFTRIHEFKHYHPERRVPYELSKTVICREYPQAYQEGREAYYPVNSHANHERLMRYQAEASKQPNLFIGGRLGAYRYWDMDQAIEFALSMFDKIKGREAGQ